MSVYKCSFRIYIIFCHMRAFNKTAATSVRPQPFSTLCTTPLGKMTLCVEKLCTMPKWFCLVCFGHCHLVLQRISKGAYIYFWLWSSSSYAIFGWKLKFAKITFFMPLIRGWFLPAFYISFAGLPLLKANHRWYITYFGIWTPGEGCG